MLRWAVDKVAGLQSLRHMIMRVYLVSRLTKIEWFLMNPAEFRSNRDVVLLTRLREAFHLDSLLEHYAMCRATEVEGCAISISL